MISFPKEKETQDRIAHFLLNIDEKIKVNNRINKNLPPHPCNARMSGRGNNEETAEQFSSL